MLLDLLPAVTQETPVEAPPAPAGGAPLAVAYLPRRVVAREGRVEAWVYARACSFPAGGSAVVGVPVEVWWAAPWESTPEGDDELALLLLLLD